MTPALEIRTAILALLEPMEAWAVVRHTPQPDYDTSKIPALGVFVIAEQDSPDGDANAGAIRFEEEIGIGVSILRGLKRPDDLDVDLELDNDAVRTLLFTNTDFTRHGPNGLFEAVNRIQTTRRYPKEGESYFAELRIEMQFIKRLVYSPVLTDDYDGTHLTVRPLQNPEAPTIEVFLPASED